MPTSRFSSASTIATVSLVALTALMLSPAAYSEPAIAHKQSVSGQEVPAPRPQDEFSFIVLGDAQFQNTQSFNRLIDQVRLLRPSFVIQVGDLIDGYKSDIEEIEAEWVRFKHQIAPLAPVPYFPVPGNHDVYGGNKRPDARLEALFEQNMGPLYYSFNYRNALFVALNSDTREAMGFINDTQMDWLRDVLAKSQAQHRFVFMHRPPLLMENFDRLHKLLAAFGVNQVFYGHHHHHHTIERDGVKYTMTNASGTLGYPNPETGSFHGLLQVAVRGDETSVAIIKADSVLPQTVAVPQDNYDMFLLSRDLLPKEVKLRPSGKNEYRLRIELENPAQRAIEVFAQCSSGDNRWILSPAKLERLSIQPGAKARYDITASFAENRQPESLPVCEFRVPLQTAAGKWIDLEKTVSTFR